MNLRLARVPKGQPLNSDQMNDIIDSAYLDCVSLIGAIDPSGALLVSGMLDAADDKVIVAASGELDSYYGNVNKLLEVRDEWDSLHRDRSE
jgi:hypothetical protein